MHHHHYHQPPERGGLLANLITLAAGAFVAYATAAGCLGQPADTTPALEVRSALLLQAEDMPEDASELDLEPSAWF